MDYAITLYITMQTSQLSEGLLQYCLKLMLIIQPYTNDFDKLKLKEDIDKATRPDQKKHWDLKEHWIHTYKSTLSPNIKVKEIAKQTGMTFKERGPLNILSKRVARLCRVLNGNGNGKKKQTSNWILPLLTLKTKTDILGTITVLRQRDFSGIFSSAIDQDVVGRLVRSKEEFNKLCEPLIKEYKALLKTVFELASVSKHICLEIIDQYKNESNNILTILNPLLSQDVARYMLGFFASDHIIRRVGERLHGKILNNNTKEKDTPQNDSDSGNQKSAPQESKGFQMT